MKNRSVIKVLIHSWWSCHRSRNLIWSAPTSLFVSLCVGPNLLFHWRPIQIQRAVCVCLCECVWCFDSRFVFGCCHCSPVLLIFKLQWPPFLSSLFSIPPVCLSFLSFRKGLWELRFNFYTFSPREPCKSLASCPWSLQFKLLSPSSFLLSPLSASPSIGLRGIIA